MYSLPVHPVGAHRATFHLHADIATCRHKVLSLSSCILADPARMVKRQHSYKQTGDNVQVTLWNFLKYNVAGGGDSSLYGVESGTFYLRNALTNLNLVAPLALLVPLSALFLMSQKRGKHSTLTFRPSCLTSQEQGQHSLTT